MRPGPCLRMPTRVLKCRLPGQVNVQTPSDFSRLLAGWLPRMAPKPYQDHVMFETSNTVTHRPGRHCPGLPARSLASIRTDDQQEAMASRTGSHLRSHPGISSGWSNTTAAVSVAATFELSYRRLDETAARMFRLLPIIPGSDVSTPPAAVLAGPACHRGARRAGRAGPGAPSRGRSRHWRPATDAWTWCACTPPGSPTASRTPMAERGPGPAASGNLTKIHP